MRRMTNEKAWLGLAGQGDFFNHSDFVCGLDFGRLLGLVVMK